MKSCFWLLIGFCLLNFVIQVARASGEILSSFCLLGLAVLALHLWEKPAGDC